MFYELAFCAALFAPPASQQRALPDIALTNDALFPPDLYLVKAHALAAAPFKAPYFKDVPAVPFEIDHVYVGPGDLKGKTVDVEIWRLDFSFSPGMIYSQMPVVKGESALLWKPKGSAKAYSRGFAPGIGLFTHLAFPPVFKAGPQTGLPIEKGRPVTTSFNFERGDAQYQLALARCEVFEKIYRAGEKDRLKVIDDYIRSGDSVRGAAAVAVLSRMPAQAGEKDQQDRWKPKKFPKIAEYVVPFSKDDALSPRVQWEVEEVLRLNKEGWDGSPAEWQMVMRWFAGNWKEQEVPWDVSQERSLLMELGIAGLANPARSKRFKAELVQTLTNTEKIARQHHPIQAKEAFAALVHVVRKDTDPARRVAAAKLLWVFAPFSDQQRESIQALGRENLGDDITRELGP